MASSTSIFHVFYVNLLYDTYVGNSNSYKLQIGPAMAGAVFPQRIRQMLGPAKLVAKWQYIARKITE